MKLADNLRDDYRFANIANPEILAASGLEGKVVLQRPRAMKNKFEESDIEYPGDKWTGNFRLFWKKKLKALFSRPFEELGPGKCLRSMSCY